MPNNLAWINVRLEPVEQARLRIIVENWGAQIKKGDGNCGMGVRGAAALAPGSGRGLSICQEICTKNGWKLWHSSKAANMNGTNTRVQGVPAFLNIFYFEITLS